MKSLKIIMPLIVIILIVIYSCGKSNSYDPVYSCLDELVKLENEIKSNLDEVSTDTGFTLKIKSENGRTFTHSTGNSNESVLYRSASTSKLVTAVVILSLVKDNILSLEGHPQDYIPTWPTSGNLSSIKLKHLLSFTSGLVNDPIYIHLPGSDIETSVENIAKINGNSKIPGEEFYYSSSHLQVAGLMAIKASGLSSWQEVFDQFKSKTGLFSNANYDLPSLQNPRLAGGMHWNAKEYLRFLEALYKKEILNPELINQMTNDQITGAIIGNSPAINAIGEDWHYGFGNWIECHANPNNCTQTTRISSPGAYGAYPFIDYKNKYYGILAREGALGTFKNGYVLFESVSSKLEAWASMDCN
ncbi:MAG: serine hydrolase [Chlorobi bacterium]|nr:serine hydrolase [Chlorobiota bacterium]